jgi:hypothetical protein
MPIPILRKLIARRVVMRLPPGLLALSPTAIAGMGGFCIRYSLSTLGGSMARSNGRWGRLRRVLNEDLSCSTATYAGASADRTPGDTPRYGAGANIENHPQVTDYIPRRFSITALLLGAGTALGVLAELVAHNADALGTRIGVSPAELTLSMSDRLVSWTIAVTLLVAAAYARVIFLLKRHRLDDLRGRYRVWRQAVVLSVVISASVVTSSHNLLARALGHLTDIRPMSSDDFWWLLPAAIVGGWVMIRLIRDAAECRLALTAFVLAAVTFIGAAACATGWSPLASQLGTESLARVLPLAGCLLSLAGTILTARYVVLDVQGLIEHPVVEAKASVARAVAAQSEGLDEEATTWTDGTEPDDDYDDDRPLSKAERKRLRKQHGRYRAA